MMKLMHGFRTPGLLDVFVNRTGLLCPVGKTPFSPFSVPSGYASHVWPFQALLLMRTRKAACDICVATFGTPFPGASCGNLSSDTFGAVVASSIVDTT